MFSFMCTLFQWKRCFGKGQLLFIKKILFRGKICLTFLNVIFALEHFSEFLNSLFFSILLLEKDHGPFGDLLRTIISREAYIAFEKSLWIFMQHRWVLLFSSPLLSQPLTAFKAQDIALCQPVEIMAPPSVRSTSVFFFLIVYDWSY